VEKNVKEGRAACAICTCCLDRPNISIACTSPAKAGSQGCCSPGRGATLLSRARARLYHGALTNPHLTGAPERPACRFAAARGSREAWATGSPGSRGVERLTKHIPACQDGGRPQRSSSSRARGQPTAQRPRSPALWRPLRTRASSTDSVRGGRLAFASPRTFNKDTRGDSWRFMWSRRRSRIHTASLR